MKCPKCGYLGFETGDRCKNCGFDFSLADLGTSTPRDPAAARAARYRQDGRGPGAGVDRPLAGQPEGTPVDLPLFGGDGRVPLPPPPRAPLAVRRSTPTPARIRQRPVVPQTDALPLDLDEPATAASGAASDVGAAADAAAGTAAGRPGEDPAPPGRRATAAAIDMGLLLLVDLVVLHFTLAVCGLTLNDVHVVPAAPMIVFFAILNGGYVVLFTGTLGQTLGKMAASIEVVPDRPGVMDLPRGALRGAAMVLSILPAGLGWLAGLVGDRRSLHDRLAGTRVVRVPGS